MDASANAGLLRRLERLERSNRRLKILAVVVLLGLGGIGVMGQARPPAQIVEAQEFIVKDASGNVRARLGSYTAGASLTLYHDAGRATLMASGGRGPGAHLSLADGSGKIRGLLLLSQEAAGLYLSSVDATGPPRSPRAVFEVLNQGTGGFAFYDKNGHTRALVGSIGDDGAAVAVLQDREGKTVWKVP